MIKTVLFDMDGVVTREDDYRLAAELTVVELLYSNQFIGLRNDVMMTVLFKPGMAVSVDRFISPKVISELKNCGINTNWDLAFFCFSIYLIEMIVDTRGTQAFDRIRAEGVTEETLRALGESLPNLRRDIEHIDTVSSFFFSFRRKRESARELSADSDAQAGARHFYEDLNAWLTERTGIAEPLLERGNSFWQMARMLFQHRYLGDCLFEQEEGKDARVSRMFKDGLINYEKPIIPVGQIIDTLAMLKEGGLSFGIATGRPYSEIIVPLEQWGLLHFFDADRIATYREELAAEKMLAARGEPASLAKPHPYLYLRALYPGMTDDELLAVKLPVDCADEVLIVGDSAADILAAKAIGCRSAVVQTGVSTLTDAQRLLSLKPDFSLVDISAIKDLF